MKQIWQDTTFTVSALTQPISVTVDGNEIYRGILSSYPGEDSVSTLLNKICEPYLEMDYPAISGVTTHSKAYRVFTVKDWSGNTLGTQDFIYDWSYEAFRNIMSKPVNGHLDERMMLPYTMWRTEPGDVDVNITEDPWIDPDYCGSDCFWDMCADTCGGDCMDTDYNDNFWNPFDPLSIFNYDVIGICGVPGEVWVDNEALWTIGYLEVGSTGNTFSLTGSAYISGVSNSDGSRLYLTTPYVQGQKWQQSIPTGETVYIRVRGTDEFGYLEGVVVQSLSQGGSVVTQEIPFLRAEFTNYNASYVHTVGYNSAPGLSVSPTITYGKDRRINVSAYELTPFGRFINVWSTFISSAVTTSGSTTIVTLSSPYGFNAFNIYDKNSSITPSGDQQLPTLERLLFNNVDAIVMVKDDDGYGVTPFEVALPIPDVWFYGMPCGFDKSRGETADAGSLPLYGSKYYFSHPVGAETQVNTSNGREIAWRGIAWDCTPKTGLTGFYTTGLTLAATDIDGYIAEIKQYNDVINAETITYTAQSSYLKVERINASIWQIKNMDSAHPVPIGDTGSIRVFQNGALVEELPYTVSNSIPTQYDQNAGERIVLSQYMKGEYTEHEDQLGCTFSFNGNAIVTVRWNTILADGIVAYNHPDTILVDGLTSPERITRIDKSSFSNNISVVCSSAMTSSVTVTLAHSGYTSFMVTNYGNSGVTDIYIPTTMDKFSDIPVVYYVPYSDLDTLHQCGRWFRGKRGQSITVHTTLDGNTITWTPDEIIE